MSVWLLAPEPEPDSATIRRPLFTDIEGARRPLHVLALPDDTFGSPLRPCGVLFLTPTVRLQAFTPSGNTGTGPGAGSA